MSASEWHVGQEVLILGDHQRRRGADPEKGVVVKVARKYVTVEHGDKYVATVEFDMETGHARGDYGSNLRCRTPDQHAEDQRHTALLAALRDRGVEFRYGANKVTTDHLAAILATFPDVTP